MKEIAIIITFHNKKYEEVKRLLDSLLFIRKDLIELIFIYREAESEIINLINEGKYSKLIDKVIKIPSGRKNAKIISATKESNAKYIQVVDPDDFILSGQLNIVAEKIHNENINVDFILNSYLIDFRKIDSTSKSLVAPKNPSSLISKSSIMKIENISDNKISQDLHFCAMAFLAFEKFITLDTPYYSYLVSEIDNTNLSHIDNVFTLEGLEEYKNNYQDIVNALNNYKYDNLILKEKYIDKILKLFYRRISRIESMFNIKNNEQ